MSFPSDKLENNLPQQMEHFPNPVALSHLCTHDAVLVQHLSIGGGKVCVS